MGSGEHEEGHDTLPYTLEKPKFIMQKNSGVLLLVKYDKTASPRSDDSVSGTRGPNPVSQQL